MKKIGGEALTLLLWGLKTYPHFLGLHAALQGEKKAPALSGQNSLLPHGSPCLLPKWRDLIICLDGEPPFANLSVGTAAILNPELQLPAAVYPRPQDLQVRRSSWRCDVEGSPVAEGELYPVSFGLSAGEIDRKLLGYDAVRPLPAQVWIPLVLDTDKLLLPRAEDDLARIDGKLPGGVSVLLRSVLSDLPSGYGNLNREYLLGAVFHDELMPAPGALRLQDNNHRVELKRRERNGRNKECC